VETSRLRRNWLPTDAPNPTGTLTPPLELGPAILSSVESKVSGESAQKRDEWKERKGGGVWKNFKPLEAMRDNSLGREAEATTDGLSCTRVPSTWLRVNWLMKDMRMSKLLELAEGFVLWFLEILAKISKKN